MDRKPLMVAVEKGSRELIDLLLGQGADVNARSGPASVLGRSGMSGAPDLIAYLVSRGTAEGV